MATLVKFRGIDRANSTSDVLTGTTTSSTPIAKRGVRVKAAQGPVSPGGTTAKKTIGTSNAQVRAIAVAGGTWANTFLKFGIVVSGAGTAFSITKAFDSAGVYTVTLNSATDGGSLATTTALAAVNALNLDPEISQYFTFDLNGATGATVVVAGAAAALTGGAANAAATTETLWIRANSKATAVVDIEDGMVAKIVRRNKDRLVSLGLA